MTILEERLKKHKRRKERLRVVQATIKGTVKKTTIFIMSAALLVYPVSFMNTNAYFLDRIRSEVATFNIENIIPAIAAMVDYELGSIIAYIRFPEGYGFDVSDINILSIQLTYEGNVIYAIPETVKIEDGVLRIEFDWNIVEKWLEDLEPGDGYPVFTVLGEGMRNGKRFLFSANNIVNLEHVVDTEKAKLEEELEDEEIDDEVDDGDTTADGTTGGGTTDDDTVDDDITGDDTTGGDTTGGDTTGGDTIGGDTTGGDTADDDTTGDDTADDTAGGDTTGDDTTSGGTTGGDTTDDTAGGDTDA